MKFKKNPSFTLKEQLGFASGSFGNCMGQDTVDTYADQFMYDYIGLPSSRILAIKTAIKGVNIAAAPLVGLLIDNVPPEKGGARKFLGIAALPLTLASVLLFVIPSDSALFKFIWVFLCYLTFNIADTFYDISLMTLSVRMTLNPADRKSFYTVSSFASTLGSMLPGWILPIVVDLQKGSYSAEQRAFFLIALIFGILGLITMLVPCFTLKEKTMILANKRQKTKLDFRALLMNRPLFLLSLSQIIDSVRLVCYNALPFFYKQTLDDYKMKSIVESISGALSYIGLASVPFAGKKMSSRTMIVSGYFFTGICYIILSLAGYKYKIVVGALIAIAGIPNAAMGAARRILLADSVDYMEWKTYKKTGVAVRSEGMVFSFSTMCNRISGLWKDLLINLGLSAINYKSATTENGVSKEVQQTPETLKGIFLLVVIPGIIGNIIPGIVMLFDNFTGERKERIMEELTQIRDIRIKEMAACEVGSQSNTL